MNAQKGRVRCIYVDGEPQPRVFMLFPREPLAKVVVVMGGEVYTFAFKEEAKEFLRQRLKLKDFEMGPCPND
jgi:hypothetical protein